MAIPGGSSRGRETVGTISAPGADGTDREAVTMASHTPSELERRLDAGEWLSGGQVATLLGVGRSTIQRRMADGTLKWRRRGGGIQRVCDPADVRRLLDESRRVHGGDSETAGQDPA